MDTVSLEAWREPLFLAGKPFAGNESPEQVELRPLVDLSQGDLTTDMAIRLAGQCKINSEIVAQNIIDSLAKNYPGRCSQVRGYINIEVDLEHLTKSHLVAQPNLEPATVLFCPKPCADPFAAMRLFGLAALQVLIRRSLGCEVELVGIDRPFQLRPSSFCMLGSEVAKSAPSAKEFLGAIGPRALEQASGRQVFFWLTSDYASGAQFGRFIREHFADKSRKDSRKLLSVPKELLLRRTGFSYDCHLEPLGSERLVALLVSFACQIRGDEFDFDISRLSEKGNIIWLLGSLGARLESLMSDMPHRTYQAPADLGQINGQYRALLLRSLMLPWFVRGGAEGGVLDFIAVLDDLLNRLSRLINTPQFRSLVAKRELSCSQCYILSGVAHTLSGIIRLVSGCCALLE
jgi:hypothetical protein